MNFLEPMMEVYAAMIDNMDQGIGRIVAELKANNMLDNTLILFLQDNGGCAETFGVTGIDDGCRRGDSPHPLVDLDPVVGVSTRIDDHDVEPGIVLGDEGVECFFEP